MIQGLCHVLVEQQCIVVQHTVLWATEKPDHALWRQLACETVDSKQSRLQLGSQGGMRLQEVGVPRSSPLCTLMPLGSYLSMRACTCSGRAGGKSKELRRESRCFWLMNLVRCSLVM